MTQLSEWDDHCREWDGCTKCPEICDGNKVFGRGTIGSPDILILGIAPGEVEDMRGKPFVGPAGKLLDDILDAVEDETGIVLTTFYINLLLCRPYDGARNRDPTHEELCSCEARLNHAMTIIRPKNIVRMGRLVQTVIDGRDYMDPVPSFDLWHPAAILRNRTKANWYKQEWIKVYRRICK